MSKHLNLVIIERAIKIWGPQSRIRGELKYRDGDHIRYCVVGALQEARKQIGLSASDFPIRKLVKVLGYNSIHELEFKNDMGPERQEDIFQEMKTLVKEL